MGITDLNDRIHYLNTFQRLLEICLNGSYLSSTSKAIYPAARMVHPSLVTEINQMRSELSDYCGAGRDVTVYKLLSKAARKLNSEILSIDKGLSERNIVITRGFDVRDYNKNIFRPIRRLSEYIEQRLVDYLVDAYLHGSLSTMDFTGYSDIDTLMILRQDVIEDADALIALERLLIRSTRYLYEYDPLQHHMHFILPEMTLKCYSESFLPLSAFSLSTSFLGTLMHMKIYLRDNEAEARSRFVSSIKHIRRYLSDRKNLSESFRLKSVLSHFMILPALYLQLKGMPVTKRESFNILEGMMPAEKWRCMKQIGRLRATWRQEGPFYAPFAIRTLGFINPFVAGYLAKRAYSEPPVRIDDGLIKEMLEFMETLTEYSEIET